MNPPIAWIVEFDWPPTFEPAHGTVARALHDQVEAADWIDEVLAASGGVGGDRSSIWVFRLRGYDELERLLRSPGDPVCDAYQAFANTMINVRDSIREEVQFL